MIRAVNGWFPILPVPDTLQVRDRSLFQSGAFSEEHRKEHHDVQFPRDPGAAFRSGGHGRGRGRETERTAEQK